MTDKAIDAFLAKPRYAILTTLRGDGSPVSVPVWFDWDGEAVRMFTGTAMAKTKRVRNDPRATVLVANDVDEPEYWVAFDGDIDVHDEGGLELAVSLAERYWDLSDPDRAATVERWRGLREGWRLLELKPREIRTYGE